MIEFTVAVLGMFGFGLTLGLLAGLFLAASMNATCRPGVDRIMQLELLAVRVMNLVWNTEKTPYNIEMLKGILVEMFEGKINTQLKKEENKK